MVSKTGVNKNLAPSTLFPFPLDDFQQAAIAALAEGKSVVVCAPTGSGKTVIGEYAIYRALSNQKRVFYTTPLKALSNQKYRDFQDKFAPFPQASVGLITGDVVLNPEAAIVVMTTEIFRNMLYETPIGEVGTSLESVETVVLDECHYISDRDRGTVWEESIIYCPPTIQLVALSATIGNPEQLTDWINQIRHPHTAESQCELINSDFRPVPLQFHFSRKKGLFPLLNPQQNGINPRLLPKGRGKSKSHRLRRQDCPSPIQVVQQLQDQDLLPAIYVIFSRRGCEQAVEKLGGITLVNDIEANTLLYYVLNFFLADNLGLQTELLALFQADAEFPQLIPLFQGFFEQGDASTEALLKFLADHPETKRDILEFLAVSSQWIRFEQVEPLTRGIASHHAGILPIWKEFVEQLFEMGLVKVVFATSTLAAGINMPARTTVISALKRRTDEGHSLLTPSEFLQIAGRAGRRGMDTVGYVVTMETPFEGAKEAAYLATESPEPLRSCFTPSYGMVLNLLQKHSLEEVKELLERSFAEYLARLKLKPEQDNLGDLTTEIAQLDIELAGTSEKDFKSYAKLTARLKEEKRLLKILQQQEENSRKQQIAPLISQIPSGKIVHLKGKHVKVATPLTAVVVQFIPGSGKLPDLLCLGEDNRWYRVSTVDIADINLSSVPEGSLSAINLPDLTVFPLGKRTQGDATTRPLSRQIVELAIPDVIPPEIEQQQQRAAAVQDALDNHPFKQHKNPQKLLKRYQKRLQLREQLHQGQIRYQKLQSRKSYYWEEFLNLIVILQQFNALDGYHPTPLGEATATIRGENELWLGLALTSGVLDSLEPQHLAGVISVLISEPLRSDAWVSYQPSPEILAVFDSHRENESTLREIRRQLIQAQYNYAITIPVWLEMDCSGIVEQWASGVSWYDLCENTSLDEGDLVRLLRRTIDVLLQIPQIPRISPIIRENSLLAVKNMKRFPI